MVDSKENYKFDMRVKGLNFVILISFAQICISNSQNYSAPMQMISVNCFSGEHLSPFTLAKDCFF